jgi:hypothetical protein
MPEIILPGLRENSRSATSVSQHSLLKELRQSQRVQLWQQEGTSEQCEEGWRNFLLSDMPDGVIYSL